MRWVYSAIFLLLAGASTVASFDSRDEFNLRQDIRRLIFTHDNRAFTFPMMAGLVRLIFHDCVGGGADGCINLDNEANHGLADYIEPLDSLYYPKWNGSLSRADFWTLGAIEAIQMGCEFTPPFNSSMQQAMPSIKFKIGRQDADVCAMHEFPNNNDHCHDFLGPEFNLTLAESVALLGAHTLGAGHAEASGYEGEWTHFPQWMDNEYFVDMINANLGWRQQNASDNETLRMQWTHFDGKFLMLNADMQNFITLELNDDESSNCTFSTCMPSPTAQLCIDFAQDNYAFIAAFSAAFQKMIDFGWPNLQEVPL